MEICQFSFRSTPLGITKIRCNIYQKVLKRISILRNQYLEGGFAQMIEIKGKDELKVLRIKYVTFGARGWHESGEKSDVEEKLMEWL